MEGVWMITVVIVKIINYEYCSKDLKIVNCRKLLLNCMFVSEILIY